MTIQFEALRLADALEDDLQDYGGQSLPRGSQDIADQAAAELRRLHEKCEALIADTIEEMRRITEIHRLTAQRDALLEALKTIEWHGAGSCWIADADKIAAAIAKAEENT